MKDENAYETVIGLEVHAQLQTKSKLFCGDSSAYGASPNSQVSVISLAHPGTLPKTNKLAIEYALKMGLSCGCDIVTNNYFARKNYFYPDLPKGYQVSQHTTPICRNGSITIRVGETEKKIRLNRIHIEEDAGKSIHGTDEMYTSIDYNRAGTPLIEIVSEPDLRSGEEAFAYLTEIRKRVRYLDICDGNMEEGSLRCDANISVRKKGDTTLGTRTEIKNLNSIRNVKRAIEAESKRLISLLEKGEPIIQQTRSFDADSGTSFAIRDKEDADDYRYFPEPDLAPFVIGGDLIQSIKKSLPLLQEEKIAQYSTNYQLSLYDATLLTDDKSTALFFEEVVALIPSNMSNGPKAAANWMQGPVRTWLNEHNVEMDQFPLSPQQVSGLIVLVQEGKLSFSAASGSLFALLLKDPKADPWELAVANNLLQESEKSAIGPIVDEVLLKFAEKVAEYRKGKKGLLALFVGEVMKRSKGKADPKLVNNLLLEKLK
jgi:aspartyl-tRNA(Asn)/glutamyl-tRNA(Gln) amidotransferase subunit B